MPLLLLTEHNETTMSAKFVLQPKVDAKKWLIGQAGEVKGAGKGMMGLVKYRRALFSCIHLVMYPCSISFCVCSFSYLLTHAMKMSVI